MMGTFHFLRPYWLIALLPALLIWWRLYRRQDTRKIWETLIAPHLLDHLMVGQNRQAKVRPIHLLLPLWLLMTFSLSGPTWQKEPSPFAEDTAGMVVLLKVTPSMLAADVQPSRLERAKQKLHDLLELRQGGATGLIVYSGSAHLVMPLTQDDRIIELMIQDLEPDTMPLAGDALADALRMAKDLFEQSEKTGSILVIADTVSPAEIAKLGPKGHSVQWPIQILSVTALGAPPDKGLSEAGDLLDAPVATLSVETADLESIHRRSKRQLKTILSEKSGERWKDSGYGLVPIIVLVSLVWARKGWKIT